MPSDHMPKEHAQAIGLALKQARESKGENLAEAAFRIALSPSQLRAIESADLTPFYSASYYRQAVDRYAAFLGVSIADIVISSPTPEAIPARPIDVTPDALIVPAEPSPETPSDPVEAVSSQQHETQEPATVSPSQDTTSAPESGSLRERFGSSADAPQPSEKQRSPLGWIALIAAIVIALGVLKVAMEKPTPTPVAEGQTPVAPPAEPQKAAPETTPSATTSTANSTGTGTGNSTSTPAKSGAPAGPPATPNAAPTPAVTTAATPAAPAVAKPPTVTPSGSPAVKGADSQLESKATTWVQIVKANGEKANLKLEPGQKIEFSSSDTAAVVFGQPDQASLRVKGRSVNLKPFVTQENPSRALVILNQIRE